jgi:copper(I)-binding protein
VFNTAGGFAAAKTGAQAMTNAGRPPSYAAYSRKPAPMRTPIAFALLAFAAPGLAAPQATRSTTAPVQEAWDQTPPVAAAGWVRLNPVPGRPSAGYLTITGGGQPDRLTGASAPGVRIEMHSMTMNGGVMAMARLDSLAVPAGSRIAFAPGGNHLMIFGLAPDTKTLPITLGFASGKSAQVVAEVRAAAAAADPHAGH